MKGTSDSMGGSVSKRILRWLMTSLGHHPYPLQNKVETKNLLDSCLHITFDENAYKV